MNGADDFEARYGQYVRPLEKEHWGKYVAVKDDGSFVMDDSLLGVMTEGRKTLGEGLFIYKVGEVAVGRLR